MGQLPRLSPHNYYQCHYAYGIDPVSTEANERGFKWAQSFWVQLQLLKGRKVDDVCGAPIVYKDSSSVEPFYIQHYNQWIVVGLFHSSSICFIERHVLVRPSMFERWYHMDAVHLSLACFLKGPE